MQGTRVLTKLDSAATNYSSHQTMSMDKVSQLLVPSDTYLEIQGWSVMSDFPSSRTTAYRV